MVGNKCVCSTLRVRGLALHNYEMNKEGREGWGRSSSSGGTFVTEVGGSSSRGRSET